MASLLLVECTNLSFGGDGVKEKKKERKKERFAFRRLGGRCFIGGAGGWSGLEVS